MFLDEDLPEEMNNVLDVSNIMLSRTPDRLGRMKGSSIFNQHMSKLVVAHDYFKIYLHLVNCFRLDIYGEHLIWVKF